MKKILYLILMMTLTVSQVMGDSWLNYAPNSSEGKKFYVTFMHNNAQTGIGDLKLHLFFAARRPTSVRIYVTENNDSVINLTVNGTLLYHFTASSYAYSSVSDSVTHKSLRIESDDSIAVYMESNNNYSGDASLILPSGLLGREYIVQTPTYNRSNSEFSIIATEPGITQVTITPTQKLTIGTMGGGGIFKPANVPYTISLSQGQVYFVSAYTATDGYSDLSGTRVCADKKVYLYNGSQEAYADFTLTSHVYHENLPVELWGKEFVVGKYNSQNMLTYKLTAAQNNTYVYENGSIVDTLQQFESRHYYGTPSQNPLYVRTSKPVTCFQYMSGDANNGTPAMIYITPLEQSVKSLNITTFNNSTIVGTNIPAYLQIVVPTSAVSSMRIDNQLHTSSFSSIPGLPGYSYGNISVTNGQHQLTNSAGKFAVSLYGCYSPSPRNTFSYAYNPGLNCLRLDAYMLIDELRTNMVKKCKDSQNQWSYDFEGEINFSYDSIVWYYDRNSYTRVRMGRGDSLHYVFNAQDSLIHDVYMYVYHRTSICNIQVVDTVQAKVNNAVTYDYNLPVEYHCLEKHERFKAFAGTTEEVTIFADTVPLNTIREIVKRFPTVDGCDSIVHFRYYVSQPANQTDNVRTCQGTPYVYEYGGVRHNLTSAGTYTYTEYDAYGCSYTRTINLAVDPTYEEHTYDTICDVEKPYRWTPKAGHTYKLYASNPDTFVVFKTMRNCDSIVHLHLVVGNSYLMTTNDSICDDALPYRWRGRTFAQTGTYYDSLKTRHGCDSVYKLKLKVLPTYHFADTGSTCGNSSYTWRGRSLTTAGLYWDSLKTRSGCDSVYSLLLRVDRAYLFEETMSVCKGEQATWRGRQLTTTNAGVTVHYDSLKAITKGCDSVYKLTLTVFPTYNIEVRRTICKGGTYEFDGDASHTWMNNVVGHHRDTVLHQTRNGCDSVLILDLKVNPVYNYDTVGVICVGSPYRWRQGDMDSMITVTTPGVKNYYSNHKTKAGCDSNYHLQLTANNTIVVQRTVTISDRDSAHWDGRVYAGTKYDKSTPDTVIATLNTPVTIDRHYQTVLTGCDSVMRLIITVYPTYEFEDHATTCQYESYSIPGHSVWTWKKDIVGSHDTLYEYKTVHGFDSLRHLYLTVYPVYHFYDTARTCCNKDYTWSGHMHIGYNERGSYDYTDPHKTINNCDSNYHLHLIVQDTITNPTVHAMCDVDTFRWDNILFAGNKSAAVAVADSVRGAGVYSYRHTYHSSSGCDSFVTMHLVIHPTYLFYDTAQTCQRNPYRPNGDAKVDWTLHIDTAGVYDDTFTYPTVHGCDSVRHLHLTVHPEYTFADTAYTCCNREYEWVGHRTIPMQTIGQHTFYDSLFTVGHHCDSVHILLLNVMDTIKIHTDKSVCENDTFTWDTTFFAGANFKGTVTKGVVLGAGTYDFRRTYISATGCDSFVTMHLVIHPTYLFYDTAQTCQRNPYRPNGDAKVDWTLHIDTAGVYDDTFTYPTVHGCDSVRHLHLTVHPEYTFSDTAYTCCNMPYEWEGHRTIPMQPVGQHTFYDSLFTVGHHCDSVHILHLNVMDTIINPTVHAMCDVDTFRWDNILFAGSKSAAVAVADSVRSAGMYSYRHTYPSSSGCDSFVTLHLVIHPTYELYDTTMVTCQHDDYLFQGQPWSWKKETVGVFDTTYRYQTTHGCDSVWHIRVRVNPVYLYEEAASTCSNEPYRWVGHKDASGQDRVFANLTPGQHVFHDSLRTVNGCNCDSVHRLTLTVVDTIVMYTRRTICDNDTVVWQGRLFRGDKWPGTGGTVLNDSIAPYVFDMTYKSVMTGCDSIERLVLRVNRTDHTILNDASICQYETFRFGVHDIVCNRTGTFNYKDSLRNIYGCDSVVEVTLRVDSVYRFDTNMTICDNTTWSWRAHTYSNLPPGTYTERDHLQTIHGCDSDYVLHLTVVSSYLFTDHYEMCDYDSIVWRTRKFGPMKADSYVYWDSLATIACGCDSVYKLELVVHSSYFIHDTLSMCDNETIQVRTHTIYGTAGKYHYIDTLPSMYNCDSIIDLTVYINPTYLFTERTTICSNQTYQWRGNSYRNAGTYWDSLKTRYGCDSVYKLELNVTPAYLFDTYKTICDNDSFVFHGQVLRDDGDHHFRYQTVNGCDSEYVVHLTVLPTYWIERHVTICDNETYQFAGRTLRHTGIYYDSIKTHRGCDSVTILHLTVRPTYHFTTTHIKCSNDTFVWRGNYYNATGVYYDSLQTEYGCDSVYELRLTVNPSYTTVIDTVICDYQHVWLNGKRYNVTGTYRDTLETNAGCDSIFILHLTVIETIDITLHDTICIGDTYTFGKSQLTQPGVYHDTICNPMMDDCAFRTLYLEVYDSTVISVARIPDICADDLWFIMDYKWHGKKPVAYSILFDEAAKEEGFEDIIGAPFPDDSNIEVPVPPCVIDSTYTTFLKNNSYASYVRPDNYTVTLQLDNGICDPKRGERKVNMLVKYPSWIIEQDWEDVVSLLNQYFNGGYRFSAYFWEVNGVKHYEETGSYLYWPDESVPGVDKPNILQLGDVVRIWLQREQEQYYLPSCEITITSHQGWEVNGNDLPFYVFNADAHGALLYGGVRIKALVDGEYFVVDGTGKRIESGSIKNGETKELQMNVPEGVYFVYFHVPDGRSTVRKVMVK